MKRRRFCWLGLAVPLAVLLTPPLLWVLIVLVTPTSWARSRVISALEQASGRSVQLDQLSVCLGGGIELSNLKIGAPGVVDDPWLLAPRVQIGMSLMQLMCGRFEPTSLDVEKASLRVRRRQDCTFELTESVSHEADQARPSTPEAHPRGPSQLKITLRQSRIVVADEPSQTSVEFEDVGGEGDWEGDGAFVANLTGRVNQGQFQLSAHLDEAGGWPKFEGQLRATGVVMHQEMDVLRYLVPVLAGTSGEVNGTLNMDLYLRGHGRSTEGIRKSLMGQGSLKLDPVQLGGTPLMAEVSELLRVQLPEKTGSIHTTFVIQDNRITTDRLKLNVGNLPILASGWTDFDGRLSYQLKVEGLTERVPDKARQWINGLDLDLNRLTSLRLTGTVDRVDIKLSGPATGGPSPLDQILTRDDRERLKTLGRRLRDKVLR